MDFSDCPGIPTSGFGVQIGILGFWTCPKAGDGAAMQRLLPKCSTHSLSTVAFVFRSSSSSSVRSDPVRSSRCCTAPPHSIMVTNGPHGSEASIPLRLSGAERRRAVRPALRQLLLTPTMIHPLSAFSLGPIFPAADDQAG